MKLKRADGRVEITSERTGRCTKVRQGRWGQKTLRLHI